MFESVQLIEICQKFTTRWWSFVPQNSPKLAREPVEIARKWKAKKNTDIGCVVLKEIMRKYWGRGDGTLVAANKAMKERKKKKEMGCYWKDKKETETLWFLLVVCRSLSEIQGRIRSFSPWPRGSNFRSHIYRLREKLRRKDKVSLSLSLSLSLSFSAMSLQLPRLFNILTVLTFKVSTTLPSIFSAKKLIYQPSVLSLIIHFFFFYFHSHGFCKEMAYNLILSFR